jgi:hypothetical protein
VPSASCTYAHTPPTVQTFEAKIVLSLKWNGGGGGVCVCVCVGGGGGLFLTTKSHYFLKKFNINMGWAAPPPAFFLASCAAVFLCSTVSRMVYQATLALLFLCAFAKAQYPPPSLSDTFEGTGEVEFHGAEATAFGKCKHSRKV